MCYTCIVSRACGHDSYQTVTCELAQPHGPLYNPLHCPDYQCLSSHTHEQCGKGGFYCAKTQDGAILDKAHDAAEVLHARLIENGSQLQIAFAANQNLLQSGTANQNLLTSPEYQRLWQNHNFLNQRRQNLERQHAYAIALISHGLQNRDRLAPGAFGQIPFSITHFDLASSIFTEDQLAPIRSLLPGRRIQPAVPQHNAGQVPAQIQPAYNNVPAFAQQQVPVPAQQSLINVPSSTQQQVPARAQQALANSVSTQQQVPGLTYSPSEPNVEAKTSRPTVNVAALSHEEIQERYRGFSPEGETKIEKGRRIGQMMKADSDKHVADQMAALGYNNIRPAPKAGNRRIAEPKPRAPKSIEKPKSEPKTTGTDSPKVSSTAAISTTPAVRRSARNLGVKHNYAETRGDSGVDADSRDPSPDKNDAAYESPDKSDASPSPPKPKKGNRTRNMVAPTSASPSDAQSHAKATLGETILQYKQGLENGPYGIKAATSSNAKGETPRADTPVLPANQTPKQSKVSQISVQNPSQAGTGRYRQILPAQSVQSPPNTLGANPAAQRSSQLAQELGRALYAHQVAAGMHGAQMVAPNTMPMSHPRPQNQHPNIMQEIAPASLTNYTQTQNVSSRPMPMQASRSTYGMAPMGTPNMFHQNLQQSISGQATNISGLGYYPAHAGQMSMSGVPIQSSQSSSMPTNFDAPRPSGGATSLNFTDPLPSNHATANTEPVKRTLSPSASSPNLPKRARLSLPGEGNAPTLAPTGPHSQNSISVNSPLTKSSDLKLSFGDTVPHQNLEVPASLTTTHPQPDPQNTTSTDQRFETLADSHSGESEPVEPLEFLLQNTQKSFQIPSAEEDAGASANAHTGEIDPLDPSDFFSLAAQEGYELPSADADTGAWADTQTAESNPIDPGDFLTMNAQGDYQFPSEDWSAGEDNQFSADDNRLTSHWMDMINDPDE